MLLSNPAGFAYLTSEGRWAPAPHLRLLARKLVDVAAGRCKRLMVFMPPRHGKSEMISHYFPAWYLGSFPDNKIILTSYEAGFAATWGRKSRDLLEEFGMDCFGVTVSHRSSASNRWDIEGYRGGMITAGVGGAITGRGADVAIIDDPVKNREEADSEVIREKTKDWYTSTLYTRLEPGASIIILMTRWHDDDLAGFLLKQQEEANPDDWDGEPWEMISLPGEAKENDPIGREEGEALWPARYDKKRLAKIRHDIGDRDYCALYDQEPKLPGGNLVKEDWIRWYDGQLPPATTMYGGVDTATSKKSTGHDSVLCETARDIEGFLYVDDLYKGQYSVKALAELVNTEHVRRQFSKIKHELNNAGEAIKQRIEEIGREEQIYPPIEGVTATQDKAARLIPFTPLIENGTIKFNRNNPKVVALVRNLCRFSAGDDFDDVDAFVWSISAASIGPAETYDDDEEDKTPERTTTRHGRSRIWDR